MPEFEPRQLLIAHESVWLAIQELFDSRGFDLVKWPEDEEIPTYLYTLRDPRRLNP